MSESHKQRTAALRHAAVALESLAGTILEWKDDLEMHADDDDRDVLTDVQGVMDAYTFCREVEEAWCGIAAPCTDLSGAWGEAMADLQAMLDDLQSMRMPQ